MSRWHYAVGIDRIEGAYMPKNLFKVAGHRFSLLFRENQTSEGGHAGNIRGSYSWHPCDISTASGPPACGHISVFERSSDRLLPHTSVALAGHQG